MTRLGEVFPGATTELRHSNAFELLVATILSAQSTDARVNSVTPALFTRFPSARALASSDLSELESLIRPTGFFRAKSRSLRGMATRLVERFGGEVPGTLDALVSLPGVGRKTANVVLGHAFGVPGLPVDRHVLRVATRIGLATGKTPEAVERQLCDALPPRLWTLASDCLILLGRRVCRPKPLCSKCPIQSSCAYYGAGGATRAPARRTGRATPRRPPRRR